MVALRSHYTMDMISGVIFAHYLWIMSEKYSFLIDWYIFGIPLEKRMATDRGLSQEEIEKQKEIQNNQSPSGNYINYPGGGVGNYFISCRNCNHPIGNYMVTENQVIHISNIPESRREYLDTREDGDTGSNQPEGGNLETVGPRGSERHPLETLNERPKDEETSRLLE